MVYYNTVLKAHKIWGIFHQTKHRTSNKIYQSTVDRISDYLLECGEHNYIEIKNLKLWSVTF